MPGQVLLEMLKDSEGGGPPRCSPVSPSFTWGCVPHPPSPPQLCPVEPASVRLAPGICVPVQPGPPPAGFPRSGQLLPGPGPTKCDLFTLLEGSPAAAKNNCLHWPVGQQEVTSPSLAHLGCDTGHSHGCRPRWLVPPGEGSACFLANFLPELLQARASAEAPHRCGRPPAGVFPGPADGGSPVSVTRAAFRPCLWLPPTGTPPCLGSPSSQPPVSKKGFI